MKSIVGVNRGHNASVTLLKDGDVSFHLENERLSNIKYDWYAFSALSKLPNYVNCVDGIAVAGLTKLVPADTYCKYDMYTEYVRNINKSFFKHEFIHCDMGLIHHQLHASTAFYNSGFDQALCIVCDGMGSEFHFHDSTYGRESTTSFLVEYPNKFEVVDKTVVIPANYNIQYDDKTKVTNSCSEAYAFNILSERLGWHGLDAGKVMGLSSYGKYDSTIPEIYAKTKINSELFCFDDDLHKSYFNSKINLDDFQIKANMCYALQKATQEKITEYILRMVEKTNCKNVCLTGGYFLNCVANYHIIKSISKDIQIYVEPISSDAGTSLGAAKYMWHSLTLDITKRKQTTLYLGLHHNYDINYVKHFLNKTEILHENVNVDTIASIIADKNIVALYQGRSESGPRALGNRSILYDPRDPYGKDEVNKVKNREWFRPFAGTVLHEYAHEWFDLHTLEESPFMMYAVKVKCDDIPAITHVDNTCRVQTLKREQNELFYDLIRCFYEKTKVPVLLNTSLNLAQDCIAETVEDALGIIRNSNINYLYLAEFKILIQKIKLQDNE